MYFNVNNGVNGSPGIASKFEIWGNTIANPDPNGIGAGSGGLQADIGGPDLADGSTACFDIGLGSSTGSAKNSLAGSVTSNGATNGAGDITLLQEATSNGHYKMVEYPLAADNGTAAPNYLKPRNDGNGTPSTTVSGGYAQGFRQVAANACH
jgi:hypothetical protein